MWCDLQVRHRVARNTRILNNSLPFFPRASLCTPAHAQRGRLSPSPYDHKLRGASCLNCCICLQFKHGAARHLHCLETELGCVREGSRNSNSTSTPTITSQGMASGGQCWPGHPASSLESTWEALQKRGRKQRMDSNVHSQGNRPLRSEEFGHVQC